MLRRAIPLILCAAALAACGESDPPSEEEFREEAVSSDACRAEAGPPDVDALPGRLVLRDSTPAQERRVESSLPGALPKGSFEFQNLFQGRRFAGGLIIAKVDPSDEQEAEDFIEGARESIEEQGVTVEDLTVAGQPAIVAPFETGVGLAALGECEGLFVFAADQRTAVGVAEIFSQ